MLILTKVLNNYWLYDVVSM